MDDRIVTFNAVCCANDECFADGVCSIDCALELLPLSIDCGAVIDAVYDGRDGYDGTVTMLENGLDACLAISSQDALSRVQELHDTIVGNGESKCPDEVLDSVGEIDVTSTCADVMDTCAQFVAMGMNCDTLNANGECDVTCLVCTPDQNKGPCEDTNPNCEGILSMGMTCGAIADGCDLTCEVCSPGHRRNNRRRRRRQQGENLLCDVANIETNTAKIDEICCDDNNGVCATGVPTTCGET